MELRGVEKARARRPVELRLNDLVPQQAQLVVALLRGAVAWTVDCHRTAVRLKRLFYAFMFVHPDVRMRHVRYRALAVPLTIIRANSDGKATPRSTMGAPTEYGAFLAAIGVVKMLEGASQIVNTIRTKCNGK